jgi:hypothetical protein
MSLTELPICVKFWDETTRTGKETWRFVGSVIRRWGTEPMNGGVPRNFVRGVGGGVQQIQLRTEGRENGDLGAVAPKSGVSLNLQMSETRILIRLLRMCFHGTGNSAQLCQKF